MRDDTELGQRIESCLNQAAERRALHQSHVRQRMEDLDRKSVRFNEIARSLVEQVLLPRLRKAASYFDNGEMAPPDERAWNHCIANFKHTEQFPASTRLDLFILPDERIENVLVVYDLSIIPIFFQFNGRDTLAISMERVDAAAVADWIDRKLIEFVETYLRLEQVDEYQRENFVTDPVCGMRINRNSAAGQSEYEGARYFFCVEECRRKFETSPEKFVFAGKA